MTRRLGTALPAALLALALATRAVVAEDPPPPTPIPAASPAPVDAPPSGPALNLHLLEAVAMGLSRNLELAAGSFDPRIACGTLDVAEGEFDPLLTLGANGGRTESLPNQSFFGTDVLRETLFSADATLSKRLTSGGTVSFILHADRLISNSGIATINPRWLSSASLEATQPLLRGAGDVALADIRRAKNGVRAADHAYRALAEDILLRIETAYWDLAYAAEQVAARRKSEDVATGLLDLVAARRDAKVATPLDVAEARAGLESRRGDRIVAEGARGAAEDALRALVLPFERGRPVAMTLVPLDDPRRGAPPPWPLTTPSAAKAGGSGSGIEEERYVALALRTRPDLLASSADLENRDIDLGVAEDGLKPQLDLFGRISTSGLDRSFDSALSRTGEGEAGTGTVGLVFSMYLGRRSAKAKLATAEYARRQAGLRQRDLENRIVAEVRGALRDLATSGARLAAAQEEIHSAGEGLAGERDRQAQGASTPFRVLEKEDLATQAVTREGRAAADLRIARARLAKATGTLAETLGVRIDDPLCGR